MVNWAKLITLRRPASTLILDCVLQLLVGCLRDLILAGEGR